MGIEMKPALMLACILSFATPAVASPIIEDTYVHVRMTTQLGQLVEIQSDGDRLTSFSISSAGRVLRVDTSFTSDVSGVVINEAKLLLDGATKTGPHLRHVLIPFQEWKGVTRKDLGLMLTFNREGLVRAMVVADGDFERPIHMFSAAEVPHTAVTK
jgi:hypothetical protein